METVRLISCETGTDLIVSFAVPVEETSWEVDSLIIMRTPKYEDCLEPFERGATVSFDRGDDEDDRFPLLQAVTYDAAAKVVTVRSAEATYELDVSRVATAELKEMCRVLRKMNFDSKITLQGI
jgi:hypothetical protein